MNEHHTYVNSRTLEYCTVVWFAFRLPLRDLHVCQGIINLGALLFPDATVESLHSPISTQSSSKDFAILGGTIELPPNVIGKVQD